MKLSGALVGVYTLTSQYICRVVADYVRLICLQYQVTSSGGLVEQAATEIYWVFPWQFLQASHVTGSHCTSSGSTLILVWKGLVYGLFASCSLLVPVIMELGVAAPY